MWEGNSIENYRYTDTISDTEHMNRLYANSILLQKGVIKYGAMTKDPFGYVFSVMGSVNGGEEKLWSEVWTEETMKSHPFWRNKDHWRRHFSNKLKKRD